MPFQIRDFHLIYNKPGPTQSYKFNKFQIQESYPDVYVFKQKSVNIGIKFRDFKTKKYGFKIKSVEIKIDMISLLDKQQLLNGKEYNNSHMRFYQDWKKYQVSFNYRLLKSSIFENPDLLQRFKQKQTEQAIENKQSEQFQKQINQKYSSFESSLKHLNQKLTMSIKNYLSKKSSVKNYLLQQNFVTKWLDIQNPIKQMFIIYKNKQKTSSQQTGMLLVETLSEKFFNISDKNYKIQPLKLILLETISIQSINKNSIEPWIDSDFIKKKTKDEDKNKLQKIQDLYHFENNQQFFIKNFKKNYKFKHNISYPQLIQDFFTNFLYQNQ